MEGLSKPVQQQSMGREVNQYVYNSNLHTTSNIANNILLERIFNLNSYIKPYHLPFTLFNYFNVMKPISRFIIRIDIFAKCH